MATHIVTSRTWADTETITKALDRNSNTINPSLLELKGGKSNTRKDTLSMNDVLVRGHQMGLKIWTTDKLQKMLTTLFDDKMGHEHTTNNTRLGNDLVQVLKNEKLAAAAEKQSSGIPKEFIAFKGPFLYVHDMDEKFRPTMMREYAKVARRTDGDWPQFRSVSAGKCPFVEDLAMKRELEKERAQEEAQRKSAQLRREREFRYGQRTATPRIVDPARMNPPRRTSPRKILRDVNQIPRAKASSSSNLRTPIVISTDARATSCPIRQTVTNASNSRTCSVRNSKVRHDFSHTVPDDLICCRHRHESKYQQRGQRTQTQSP